jgi:hypothetical protein
LSKKRLVFFGMTGVASFVFLLTVQMYFFAAVIALSQMVLVFSLIPALDFTEEKGRRKYLGLSSFFLFFLLFALLFQGNYRWPRAFDWAGAKSFHLAFGGEWLLLFSVCVAFGGVVSALIVRRAK